MPTAPPLGSAPRSALASPRDTRTRRPPPRSAAALPPRASPSRPLPPGGRWPDRRTLVGRHGTAEKAAGNGPAAAAGTLVGEGTCHGFSLTTASALPSPTSVQRVTPKKEFSLALVPTTQERRGC